MMDDCDVNPCSFQLDGGGARPAGPTSSESDDRGERRKDGGKRAHRTESYQDKRIR